MKIRRVRRGFTTNSSAYTEWLPPEAKAPAAAATGSSITPTQSVPGPVAGSTSLVGPTSIPAPQNPLITPTQSTVTGTPENAHLGGNLIALGGIVVAIAAAFVIDRVVRRRKKTSTEQDDD